MAVKSVDEIYANIIGIYTLTKMYTVAHPSDATLAGELGEASRELGELGDHRQPIFSLQTTPQMLAPFDSIELKMEREQQRGRSAHRNSLVLNAHIQKFRLQSGQNIAVSS